MMLFNKPPRRYGQSGFTLVEVLVSVAITGLIGLGAAISSTQVIKETVRNKDYTAASRNVMNAVFWISRDAQMAQAFSGVEGFPATSDLSLSWKDWENSTHNATYSVEDGRLIRSYNVDGQTTETLIAEHVDADIENTNCASYNGTLTLTITCSVGEGAEEINVTRVREMVSRPGL